MSGVKICGLRRMEDIEVVNQIFPDFIGFVFAESRRRVDVETAAKMKERLDKRIQAAGVFVNQEIEYIADIYRKGIINLIQLHGDEDASYISRLREICDCKIIKSVSVGAILPEGTKGADYLLFDTASAQRGGAGKTFDWKMLKNYQGVPYFLAGGLTPENAGRAVKMLSPFCVDVSSGVETNGFKDADKISKFVQTVRRIK